MQIKRFKAKTMTEALKNIKLEFGPDAVILSARNLNKGSGLFLKQENIVEVTAATDSNDQSKNINYGINRYSSIGEINQNEFYSNSMTNSRETGVVADLSFKPSKYGRKNRLSVSNTKKLFNVYSQLLSQQVDEYLAVGLARGLNQIYLKTPVVEDSDIKMDLARLVEDLGVSAGRIKLQKGKQRIVALIGTSGVGKTTTFAKIAALGKKYLNQNGVGMITIDDYRIGAIEQARIYSNIMGIEMESVADSAQFKIALKRLSSKNLIVIDTPGINPKNKEQLKKISAYLSNLNPIEIHLILGAKTKSEDMLDDINHFKILPISHLLFTKVDESLTHGNILNQLVATKIPVSYFSTGHRVPEDFESATIDKLLGLVLKDLNQRPALLGSPESLAKKIDAFEELLNEDLGILSRGDKNFKLELKKNVL